MNTSLISRLAAGLLSAAGLACTHAVLAGLPAGLSTALPSELPHVSLGESSALDAKLIGTWTVEYSDIKKDGTTVHRTGQFMASWVLDGRAVQYLWIVDPSGARKEREVYTELRYFDPQSRSWNGVFFDPEHASTAKFTSEPQGDKIVMHSSDLGAADSRWTFGAIGPNSLVFRDEASDDGGKTWHLRSEDHMTRQATAKPAG
jgi:hypothetical protein